jgi:hypothetical protein
MKFTAILLVNDEAEQFQWTRAQTAVFFLGH